MIRSSHNPRLKDIRSLRRSKGDRVLLEGDHLIAEALGAGVALEYLLATPEALDRSDLEALFQRLPIEAEVVDPGLLAKATDADSPKGLVAVASLPRSNVESIPADGTTYLFVDGLQNPGNLGALSRCAEATGVAAMVLTPGCAHPNHPRALRASAGSLLRMPVAVGVDVQSLDRHLAGRDAHWIALQMDGSTPLWNLDPPKPTVLALGSEGRGLSAAVQERVDQRVSIPMDSPVESLNATIAAALVLYELRRGSS